MAEPRRHNPPRLLEVLERRALSPRVLRLTLGGPGLVGLPQCWPGAHIKLFFPRGDQQEPVLPTLGADGRPVWPPPDVRPVVRTYSVRRHDPDAERLDVDFVLHEPTGPASSWAERAVPGTRVGFAGPGGPRPLLGPGDWHLLAGDLSALPAMGALLEGLPASARGHAFIEVPDAREIQHLAAPPAMHVNWLVERDLVEAVQAAPWLGGAPFVWLAGEGSQVVALRDWARREHGVPATALYAVPYWKRRLNEEQYHQERHRVMDELLAEQA